MKSIKQQYIDLQEGNMSQANFMRNLRMSLPQYITNVTSFEDSVRILKNKGILTEADMKTKKNEMHDPEGYDGGPDAMFGIEKDPASEKDAVGLLGRLLKQKNDLEWAMGLTQRMHPEVDINALLDRYNKHKEAGSPTVSYNDDLPFFESLKEAKDEKGKWTNANGKSMYDQFKEIDNLNGQEVLIGIDAEMERNHELSKKDAAKIVIKNLKKNPLYYTMEYLAGKEGAEAEYMGGKSANAEARQMQPLDKNMGNVVDKKMGMQPVKGVEKAKKDADAKSETNKTVKGVELMSLIAKTVRGLKKMDATGEKMKKVVVKEARLNDMPNEAPGKIARQIMGYVESNPILKKYSDEITLQSNPDGFLRFGYWDELPSDALAALEKQFIVKADSDYDEDTGTLMYYNLTPKHTAGTINLGKADLMQMIREELKEMISNQQETDDVALGIDETYDGMEPMSRKGLDETKLFADFSLDSDDSIESRFARSISEVAREYDYMDNIDIPGYFDVYEDGDDVYAGPTESLRFFQTLPDEFIVTNNMNDIDESFKITKTGDDSFTAEEI